MTTEPPAEPAEPPAEGETRSTTFREVARVCLNVVVTFVTLTPLLFLAIHDDIDGLVAELLAQAVIVAGVLAKVMAIPQVNDWLNTWKPPIGKLPPPALPVKAPPAL